MSASPTMQAPDAIGPPAGHGELTPHHLLHRVVSVSPHVNMPPSPPPPLIVVEARQETVGVRETIDAIGSQIDQARDLLRRLSGMAAHAKEGEAEAVKSIAQLQDRLRVSAQMLKAFQVQIARVDQALAEVAAQEKKAEAVEVRLHHRLAEVEARVESAMQRLDDRVNEAVLAAEERINFQWDQCAAAAAHRPTDDGDRLVQTRTELDRLAATIQDAARQIANVARPVSVDPIQFDLLTAGPPTFSIETRPRAEPFIQITPPMRLHSLACPAD